MINIWKLLTGTTAQMVEHGVVVVVVVESPQAPEDDSQQL